MRIAQVSPLVESVPPQFYGGTERIVSYLTEELVRQGHDVTLYASGDSLTSARLRPMCDRALRLHCEGLIDPMAQHVLLLEHVMQEARDFDVIHFHLDYLPFSHIRRLGIPALTTLHGRLDIACLQPVFREFNEMHLVSISDSQRKPMPWAGWAATIHHGIPEDLYKQGDGRGGYLAFLGRISPEKRVDRAVEISQRAGMPLRIAAKIDAADKIYFEENIRDLLDSASVDFVGEICESEKDEFLGNARGLLFPIDWPEPFGLVIIEAMACGTPIVAFRGGAVEEIIEDGITGFVVSNIDEAVEAVSNLGAIDRSVCRARFEQRFSVSRMCRDYVSAYRRVQGYAASARKNGHFKHNLLPGAVLSDELTTTERK
jgi:glycosyltransferase involved in cell wall biosynthesis